MSGYLAALTFVLGTEFQPENQTQIPTKILLGETTSDSKIDLASSSYIEADPSTRTFLKIFSFIKIESIGIVFEL